jgi:hypothetical protein
MSDHCCPPTTASWMHYAYRRSTPLRRHQDSAWRNSWYACIQPCRTGCAWCRCARRICLQIPCVRLRIKWFQLPINLVHASWSMVTVSSQKTPALTAYISKPLSSCRCEHALLQYTGPHPATIATNCFAPPNLVQTLPCCHLCCRPPVTRKHQH